MLLQELLESIYKYKWTKEGAIRSVASFPTKDETNVAVHFGESAVDNIAQVIFYRGLHTNTTSQGDAFKIFSTVIAVMKDFHKKHPDQGLAFEANESDKTRISLYSKFASRGAKELGLQTKRVKLENGECFVIAKQPLLDAAIAKLEDRGYLED